MADIRPVLLRDCRRESPGPVTESAGAHAALPGGAISSANRRDSLFKLADE
jgi:hypothetical protein